MQCCTLLFLCATLAAIALSNGANDDVCIVKSPPTNFGGSPPGRCNTCKCRSSKHAKFYNPRSSSPTCCSANTTATYRVTFQGSWAGNCHNNLTGNAGWSEFVAISHNGPTKIFDGCFERVSKALRSLAERGDASDMEDQFGFQKLSKRAFGFARGPRTSGTGRSRVDDLQVNPDFPYVSTATMQGRSADRIVGVSRLRLCNKNGAWYRKVKVCVELFSTATNSMRLGSRNSVQGNECSYGFFTFTRMSESPIAPPPPKDECRPKAPPVCPGNLTSLRLESCNSCCCVTTSNAQFYRPVPGAPPPRCMAPPSAYQVSFHATWSAGCHHDYYFPGGKWSPFSAVSHNYSYQVWEPCMSSVSPGVSLLSQTGAACRLEQEYRAQGAAVGHYVVGDLIPASGWTSGMLKVDAHHPLVSMATMLVPSPDRMMGVAGLNLCDFDKWHKRVKVCGELFSTATSSPRVGRPNSLQMDNCSFGYFEFKLKPTPRPPTPPPTPPPPPPPPQPTSPKYRDECSKEDLYLTNPLADSCPCQPKIPRCTGSQSQCSSCCCNSSENVEFYNSNGSNPVCTAKPARYRVTFVGTWTRECHPDYYFSSAHWSPLTGVSHNSSYEVWNACMYDVTRGVASVSQTGSTANIRSEYAAQGSKVRSTFQGRTIFQGEGMTTAEFNVDFAHPYASALTMLAPSADRMMGVSRLQLCSGSCWKDSVKVCGELFSTATRSDLVQRPNTIQANNCSFGYFLFERISCEGGECAACPLPPPPPSPTRPPTRPPRPRPPPPPPQPTCPKYRDECSKEDLYLTNPLADSCPCQPKIPRCTGCSPDCPTCCCRSSENVEFYKPNGSNPVCTAKPARYRATFVGTWTKECHPDYYFSSAHWSPLTGVSHDPSYEVWNACMYNVTRGVASVSQTGSTANIRSEYAAQGSKVSSTFQGQTIFPGEGMTTAEFNVDSAHPYASALTMLAPSADRMMGVSRLQLCSGSCWKDSVKVCGELFSTATRSDLVQRPNTIQANNCSFGYFLFERISCDGGECAACPPPPPPPPPPTKEPTAVALAPQETPQSGLKGKRFDIVCKRNDFVFRGVVTAFEEEMMPGGHIRTCLHVSVVRHYKCPNCGPLVGGTSFIRVYIFATVDVTVGGDYLFAGTELGCPGNNPVAGMSRDGAVSVKAGSSGFFEAWSDSSVKKAARCSRTNKPALG